jgi:hypothetical protein
MVATMGDDTMEIEVEENTAAESATVEQPRSTERMVFLAVAGSMALAAVCGIAIIYASIAHTDNNESNTVQLADPDTRSLSRRYGDSDASELWDEYKRVYQKSYSGSRRAGEEATRFGYFQDFLALVDQRNDLELANNPRTDRAVHGITRLADRSATEIAAMKGLPAGLNATSSRRASRNLLQSTSTAPCSRTWDVGLSRNQGQCGNCWTYSTAETIRWNYHAQHGVDPGELSTQYIVDCAPNSENGRTQYAQGGYDFNDGQGCTTPAPGAKGCCGGWPYVAMKWIAATGGIPTVAQYGDRGVNNTQNGGPSLSGQNPTTAYPCKSVPKAVTLTEPTSVVQSSQSTPYSGQSVTGDEASMANAVCDNGVLSIVVNAGPLNSYVGGVLTQATCADTAPDHAIQVVGIDASRNAWVVRNQWAADWGETADGSTGNWGTAMGPWTCANYWNWMNNDCYQAGTSLTVAYCENYINNYLGLHATQAAYYSTCYENTAVFDEPWVYGNGGYALLQYGENTCNIGYWAIQAAGTSAV